MCEIPHDVQISSDFILEILICGETGVGEEERERKNPKICSILIG